jgi:AraC family L-rhamnose operon regulatory protein RhaS
LILYKVYAKIIAHAKKVALNFTWFGGIFMDFNVCINEFADEEILNINKSREILKVVLIEKGNGIVRFSDDKKFFSAPSLIYLNEKEEIDITTSSETKAKVLLFHPSVINDIFIDFGTIRKIKYKNEYHTDLGFLMPFIDNEKTEKMINLSMISYKHIESILKNINKYVLEKSNFYEMKIKSLILELLVDIIEFSNSVEIDDNKLYDDSNEMDNIIMYLYENYNKKVSISDITSVFNINRTTLSKKFLNYTGKTIIAYLTEIRIKKAVSYLEQGNNTVYEIMTMCGFNDMGHFNRTFHKYIGHSPMEYKKTMILS